VTARCKRQMQPLQDIAFLCNRYFFLQREEGGMDLVLEFATSYSVEEFIVSCLAFPRGFQVNCRIFLKPH
jgi:hypothetical protein